MFCFRIYQTLKSFLAVAPVLYLGSRPETKTG
jgi:hypothetical protein